MCSCTSGNLAKQFLDSGFDAMHRPGMTKLPDHRRPLIRYGHVEHAELYALGALPAVDRERARDMQRLAAMLGQRVAEFLSDRAERDAVDDRAVAGFEPQAQMRLPHFIGIDQLMRR